MTRMSERKNWIYEKTFPNQDEAFAALDEEKCWSFGFSNKSIRTGKKTYFRCNKVKYRAKEKCAASVYLQFDPVSDAVHLFRCDTEHTHDQLPEKTSRCLYSKLKPDVAAVIREMTEIKMTPNVIIHSLQKRGYTPPTKPQLLKYLSRLQRQKSVQQGRKLLAKTLKKNPADSKTPKKSSSNDDLRPLSFLDIESNGRKISYTDGCDVKMEVFESDDQNRSDEYEDCHEEDEVDPDGANEEDARLIFDPLSSSKKLILQASEKDENADILSGPDQVEEQSDFEKANLSNASEIEEFFRAICSTVKTFPKNDAAEIKLEISQIVYRKEIDIGKRPKLS